MRFNLISPTITFSTERKYSVNVGDDDDDQTTIKVPVFENGHPEAVLKWRKHFDELIELKLLTSRQNFNNAALLLTGEAKEHWEDSKLSTPPTSVTSFTMLKNQITCQLRILSDV
jgi:hypothetical protein